MQDPEVTRYPGVHSRPGTSFWWFYQTVPADLAHRFKDQWAERVSLKTRDLREANAEAKKRAAAWEVKFSAMRREDNPERVEVTPALAAAVAQEARRWVLQADDKVRSCSAFPRALLDREERKRVLEVLARLMTTPEGQALSALLPPATFSPLTIGNASRPSPTPSPAPEVDPLAGLTEEEAGALSRWNAGSAAAAAVDTARQNLRAVLPLAELVLKSWGLSADWTTPEGRQGLREVLKAYRQAAEEVTRRDAGEVVNTPPAPLPPTQAQEAPQEAAGAPPAARQGHTPMDAYKVWEKAPSKSGKPRPVKSLKAYESAAEKLAELMPGKTLESMNREDGRNVVAALLQEAQARGGGVAQNTAVKLLSRFKTLLNAAVDVEWIDKSPLQGRTIARVKSDRDPWKLAELVKLFDDPVFTAYAIPEASMAGKDAAYWLPLLGLYTGARISELAQLGIDDLQQTEEAGWVLSIHEEGEDQTVKNEHSIRAVPVHPELIRLGLIDYWQAVKDAGAEKLWPGVVFSELNGAGGKISQWFSEFKTGKGFGRRLVFHSFRHTLETELRALSVPKYHIAALAGHAGDDVSDDYAHPTPAVLRPVLERLTFPGLDLPRVFKAPVWKP